MPKQKFTITLPGDNAFNNDESPPSPKKIKTSIEKREGESTHKKNDTTKEEGFSTGPSIRKLAERYFLNDPNNPKPQKNVNIVDLFIPTNKSSEGKEKIKETIEGGKQSKKNIKISVASNSKKKIIATPKSAKPEFKKATKNKKNDNKKDCNKKNNNRTRTVGTNIYKDYKEFLDNISIDKIEGYIEKVKETKPEKIEEILEEAKTKDSERKDGKTKEFDTAMLAALRITSGRRNERKTTKIKKEHFIEFIEHAKKEKSYPKVMLEIIKTHNNRSLRFAQEASTPEEIEFLFSYLAKGLNNKKDIEKILNTLNSANQNTSNIPMIKTLIAKFNNLMFGETFPEEQDEMKPYIEKIINARPEEVEGLIEEAAEKDAKEESGSNRWFDTLIEVILNKNIGIESPQDSAKLRNITPEDFEKFIYHKREKCPEDLENAIIAIIKTGYSKALDIISPLFLPNEIENLFPHLISSQNEKKITSILNIIFSCKQRTPRTLLILKPSIIRLLETLKEIPSNPTFKTYLKDHPEKETIDEAIESIKDEHNKKIQNGDARLKQLISQFLRGDPSLLEQIVYYETCLNYYKKHEDKEAPPEDKSIDQSVKIERIIDKVIKSANTDYYRTSLYSRASTSKVPPKEGDEDSAPSLRYKP